MTSSVTEPVAFAALAKVTFTEAMNAPVAFVTEIVMVPETLRLAGTTVMVPATFTVKPLPGVIVLEKLTTTGWGPGIATTATLATKATTSPNEASHKFLRISVDSGPTDRPQNDRGYLTVI